MREVRFRAWNKKKKFMDSAWLIDWEHRKVCHSSHNQSDLDDCILMQYTGLKDMEGKEIFEGDTMLNVLFDDLWVVKFVEDAYILENEKINYEVGLGSVNDTFKVIGNIYEKGK